MIETELYEHSEHYDEYDINVMWVV